MLRVTHCDNGNSVLKKEILCASIKCEQSTVVDRMMSGMYKNVSKTIVINYKMTIVCWYSATLCMFL